MKSVFEKIYTRDFSIVIVESWAHALTLGFQQKTGFTNPHRPAVIYHYHDGAIEQWHSKGIIAWITDRIFDAFAKDPAFLTREMDAYESRIHAIETALRAGRVADPAELVRFCDQSPATMLGWVIFYHCALNEKIPERDRVRAQKIRDTDHYWERADKLIRNSLVELHPELHGVEATVTTQEIRGTLPPRAELEKRFRDWIYIPGQFSQTIDLETYAAQNPHYEFERPDVKRHEITEIRGQCAFAGTAKGNVRILRRKDQIALVQPGEILVSPMTTPDFVPAMHKAAGIVTDEGGTLYHAAVVAREMKKPCIVGTKIASQALHDGDLVEMDAQKGTVRLLGHSL